MPDLRPGQSWEGLEYNERLSPQIPRALGGAILRASIEATTHPGLYWDRTDDIATPQLSMRPGFTLGVDELALFSTNPDGTINA